MQGEISSGSATLGDDVTYEYPQLIKPEGFTKRLFGTPDVQVLKAEKNVNGLVKALCNEDEHIRKASAVALDALGWQPDHDQIGAQYWIAHKQFGKCAEIGAPAVDSLLAVLKHMEKHVREVVLLGKTGGADAVVLQHKREWATIAETLGRIGNPCAVPFLIDALKQAPPHHHFSVPWAAACALGEIGDQRAVKPLIIALKNNSRYVRKAAAGALGKLGDTRALEPLRTLLENDKNAGVRDAATKALERIGTPLAQR